MKRSQLLVLSVLALGLQGVAQASPFPADAEASISLPALETYADRYSGASTSWGVSRRMVQPHDPFPFGGGNIDD